MTDKLVADTTHEEFEEVPANSCTAVPMVKLPQRCPECIETLEANDAHPFRQDDYIRFWFWLLIAEDCNYKYMLQSLA